MSKQIPTVLCLVGSVKQEKDWRDWTAQLTSKGYVVFEAGVYGTLGEEISEEIWKIVEKVHWRKIELSDLVLIISKPDGSIGKHTQADIKYAKSVGKLVQDINDFWVANRIDEHFGV